jgi:transposase InsO family protein
MANKSQALAALNIPRSNFYYRSVKDEKDNELRIRIEAVLREHPAYGHRRVAIELKVNKKRIKRVMRKYDIRPRRSRKRPRYKHALDTSPPTPNLLVALVPLFKNHVWATDFTYIRWHGRFVYLCTIIDLYTREIVGVSVKTNHSALLVAEALLSAIQKEGPAQITHSDQGSEYRSTLFRSILSDFNIQQSMSAKGSPWQNGFQESFYGNFKVDLGDVNRYSTLGELISELYRSIYYYNNLRIHLALGCAPTEFARRASINYTIKQEELAV